MRKLGKAMIFAAGLGTRLRPLTDNMPKALVEVGGKPLLGHLMERLRDNGFEDVVVNVHYFADMIEDYVRANNDFGMRVSFSDERTLLRDTGGGLLHARNLLEGSGQFLVHNVDVLSNLADFSHFSLPKQDVSPYGPEDEYLKVAEDGRGASGSPVDVENNCEEDSRGGCLANLIVSERETSRYLLFDEELNLVGWENRKTGEVRSPYMVSSILKGQGNEDRQSSAERRNGAWQSSADQKDRVRQSSEDQKDGTRQGSADQKDRVGQVGLENCPKLRNAKPYAFSGIHIISDKIFPLLEKYSQENGEVFSITDFYISVCGKRQIRGLIPENFRMVDVGKISSLSAAEDFLASVLE